MVDDILVFNKELTALEVLQISDSQKFQSIINKSENELTKNEKEILKKYSYPGYSEIDSVII